MLFMEKMIENLRLVAITDLRFLDSSTFIDDPGKGM